MSKAETKTKSKTKTKSSHPPPWYVYILRCADNSLYCGITTDITRREQEHNGQKKLAAKYTRARQPVKVVYQETLLNRSMAGRRECAIKKLNKKTKEMLVRSARQICLFHI